LYPSKAAISDDPSRANTSIETIPFAALEPLDAGAEDRPDAQ
jgi:hypothetical protein